MPCRGRGHRHGEACWTLSQGRLKSQVERSNCRGVRGTVVLRLMVVGAYADRLKGRCVPMLKNISRRTVLSHRAAPSSYEYDLVSHLPHSTITYTNAILYRISFKWL